MTLSATTLRFAQTNEVATVSNASIVTYRIVNFQRSVGAIVAVDCAFQLKLVSAKNILEVFQRAIQDFVRENPRIWETLLFFRFDVIDADLQKVTCRMALRHRNSWQDGGRILRDRGDFLRFLHRLGEKLGINLNSSSSSTGAAPALVVSSKPDATMAPPLPPVRPEREASDVSSLLYSGSSDFIPGS
jgi:hypothetical protein